MAYTLDDFKHDTWRLLIEEVNDLSPEERQALLDRMDVEDRLRGLGAEERLRGLGVEERLRGLGAEERLRGLDVEERLRGLDPTLVEEWLKRIKH
jgi:hypothetical protein